MVNFGDSTLFEDRVQETLLAPVAYVERILTAVDCATKKIQLLTLLPQFCPLFIPSNVTPEDVRNLSKTECLLGRLREQFLRDVRFLTDWPSSKKSEEETTARDGRVVPTVDEKGHEDHGGMCQPSKKIQVALRRDKFRRQFLRELLAASNLMLTENAAGSHVDVDTDIMYNPEAFPIIPKKSVVQLLKLGLKSRYSSHIRQSLKERDVQATICILSIIASTVDETMEGPEKLLSSPSEKVDDFEEIASAEGIKESVIVEGDYSSLGESTGSNTLAGDDNSSTSDEVVKMNSSTGMEQFNLSKHDPSESNLDNYKVVLSRVLNFLNTNPETLLSVSETMKNIYDVTLQNKTEFRVRAEPLQEFLTHINQLRDSLAKRMRSLEIDFKGHKMSSTTKSEYDSTMSTKRILELEQSLSETKSRWDIIFMEREIEIEMLNTELQSTTDETAHSLLQTVKQLETKNMLQNKVHKQRLKKLDSNADNMEERLIQSIVTLDSGYRGLRLYRRAKEAELKQVIMEYDDAMAKERQILNELSQLVKENHTEMQRLDDLQTGMADRYEEMKTTKRLRELLMNLQMAESVKENWAARRIQTYWKKYKARKLRKRRLKKPKTKKHKDEGDGKKAVAGRRKSVKKRVEKKPVLDLFAAIISK